MKADRYQVLIFLLKNLVCRTGSMSTEVKSSSSCSSSKGSGPRLKKTRKARSERSRLVKDNKEPAELSQTSSPAEDTSLFEVPEHHKSRRNHSWVVINKNKDTSKLRDDPRYFQSEPQHALSAPHQKVPKASSGSYGDGSQRRLNIPEHSTPLSLYGPGSDLPAVLYVAADRQTLSDSKSLEENPSKSHEESFVKMEPVSVLGDETSRVERQFSAEQSKLIAELQSQLQNRELEIKTLLNERDRERSELHAALGRVRESEARHEAFKSSNDKVLRETREAVVRLRAQLCQSEEEKLQVLNDLVDRNKKVEDLQVQLEEQILASSKESKEPSGESLEKVLGLEEKLHEKESEIQRLNEKLRNAKSEHESESSRLVDKDHQLDVKNQEIVKLRELLSVSKDHELLRSGEIEDLKRQLTAARDLQGSLSDAERRSKDLESSFEKRYKEKVRQIEALEDELHAKVSVSDNLQVELAQKDNKISDLEYRIGKCRDELNDAIDSRGVLNKQICELNSSINEKRAQYKAVEASIENLRRENLGLKAKLEVAESRNQQIVEDRRKLEEEILKLSKNSGDSAQQLLYLSEQLQAKNREIASLHDQLSSRTAETHRVTQELKDFKEKSSRERNNYEKGRAEELKKLRDAIAVMENHVKQMRDDKEKIAEDALQGKMDAQVVAVEIASLKKLVIVKDEEIAGQKRRIDDLLLRVEELKEKEQGPSLDVEPLKSEIARQSQEAESLKLQLDTLLVERQSWTKCRTQLESDLAAARTDKNDLEERLRRADLERQYAEREQVAIAEKLDDVLSKAELLKRDKKSLKRSREKLQEEKITLHRKCDELTTLLSQASSEAATQQAEAERLRDLHNQGSSALSDIQQQLILAREELSAAKANISSLEKDNAALLKRHLEVSKERSKLECDLACKAKTVHELQGETDLLRGQLRQALDREAAVRDAYESDRLGLQHKLDQAIGASRQKENELAASRCKVLELERRLSELAVHDVSFSNSKESSVSHVTAINNRPTCPGTEYASLEQQLLAMRKAKAERDQEVDFLNSLIIDLQRKNKDLENQIKGMQSADLDLSTSETDTAMSAGQPRVTTRLFCDSCDVFGKHDTGNCPGQGSSDVENQPLDSRGHERPYCTVCEGFGHLAEDCDDEQGKRPNRIDRLRQRWLRLRLIEWKQAFHD